VLGAIFAALLLVMWLRWPGGAPLKELPRADVARLSPVLVAGTVAPAHNPKVFVGQVDKSRWALMSLSERRKEAESLARNLVSRGWFSGTVMMEQQVVIQVEQGTLLIVQ
jgi:hypothetical protein